ncbi:uncharacterized protein [Mytilus edulis]|uniref:uncharacterized protein n=1 Tax=Mytilus edulis TaxID=6550 RepID=UPI0039EF7B2F
MNTTGLTAKIEESMERVVCQNCRRKFDKQEIKDQPVKPYKLGKPIFTMHQQTDLTSKVGDMGGYVTDIVMMDDGRLVICIPKQRILLICNTDGSQIDSIDVQGKPICVTAVNNSTVAVPLLYSYSIEMYDINNKLTLKSISVPRITWTGITTINNKLVVSGNKNLLTIDHQTGEVVQTIQSACYPYWLHGSGDRIFYCDNFYNNNKKLYWYSCTDNRHHTLTLPAGPRSMTTLQDGSLYVTCNDGSVQHVSYDGKQYKSVKTKGFQKLKYTLMSYNLKQRKLIIKHERVDNMWIFNVFYEE